jgi:cytoskeleton protein RodZ
MSGAGMMNEPATTPVASETSGDAAGAALLKERRRQGLSLGDISRQLKLSVRQVEALERDDYSAYKGPVFIHGFIRNYAKLLGLDPEPLIRSADTLLKPPGFPSGSTETGPEVAPARTNKSRSLPWGVIGLALIVLLAISVYFGGGRAPDTGRRAPAVVARENPVQPKTPADTRSGPETNEPRSRADVNKGPQKPVPKAETRPEANARSEATTRVPVEAAAPIAVDGSDGSDGSERLTVRMIFDQDSWVEIKDRAGNTIFGQLAAAGSRRSISGERPLTVVVGNAAGVRLFQGDKSIDLAPYTRVDVARLTLE